MLQALRNVPWLNAGRVQASKPHISLRRHEACKTVRMAACLSASHTSFLLPPLGNLKTNALTTTNLGMLCLLADVLILLWHVPVEFAPIRPLSNSRLGSSNLSLAAKRHACQGYSQQGTRSGISHTGPRQRKDAERCPSMRAEGVSGWTAHQPFILTQLRGLHSSP